MIIGIQAALTKLKAFVDSFTRADDGATLKASGTKNWQNIRGTWGISSNRASTATSASSYPLASIKTGTVNATVRIGVGATTSAHGWGSAYWLEDSNNWYATYTDRTYYQTGPFTGYSCPPSGFGAFTANCTGTSVAASSNGTCGNPACTGGNGPCHQYQPCSGFVAGTPTMSCSDGMGGTRYRWELCGAPCSGGNPGTTTNVCGGGCGFVNACAASQSGLGGDAPKGANSYQYYTDNYLYFLRTVKNSAGSISTLNSTQIANTTSSSYYTSFVQAKTNFPSTNSVRITSDAGTYDVAVSSPLQGKSYGVIIAPVTSGTNAPTQASTVDNFDYTPTA